MVVDGSTHATNSRLSSSRSLAPPRAPERLDDELFLDGAEEPLHLAAPLRSARPRVDQSAAEHRQAAQQLPGDKRRAVIDIDGLRPAARPQPEPQCHLQPHHVLGQAEPVARRQARPVIVQETEQDRGPRAKRGPRIASPTHNSFGADASKRPNAGDDEDGRPFSPERTKWRWIVRADGEDPSRARMIRAICTAVRSGASRLSASAQLQHPHRRARHTLTRRRNKRLKPALTPRPSPAIKRHPRDRDPRPHGVRCSRAASSLTARPRASGRIIAKLRTSE